MKAGMVLGIIGGVIALLIGAIGYSLSSGTEALANAVGGSSAGLGFYKIASILLPVIGLFGAGLTGKNANLAIALMAISAVGMVWSFGFGLMTIVPAGLLAIGAVLVALDKDKGPYVKP